MNNKQKRIPEQTKFLITNPMVTNKDKYKTDLLVACSEKKADREASDNLTKTICNG